MIITQQETNSEFKPVPPGMHLARCYRLVDLGTQKGTYQGVVSYKRKVMVQFEIHGEDDNGNKLVTSKGEPMSISKNYTKSIHENARLTIDLQSWRGVAFTADERKKFDLSKILGAWAMISVAKSAGDDGKEYTNIVTINPVPSSIKKAGLPEGFNEAEEYEIAIHNPALFESFGDKLKDKIKSSPEWQEKNGKVEQKTESEDYENDDIPF